MHIQRARRGNIVVIALTFLFLFAFLAASMSLMSRREYHQTFRTINQHFAFLLARSLLAEAEAEIRDKANTLFKDEFLNYDHKRNLKLDCATGPRTRALLADLTRIDPPGNAEELPWEVTLGTLKVKAFIYKDDASLPKGRRESPDRMRFVKIEAEADCGGARKELWLVLAAKVVDVRPVANEYVSYCVDGDFKGFTPSSGESKGLGKRANPDLDKWVNHKASAGNRFETGDLTDYLQCAYRTSSSLNTFYQGSDLWVEGLAYIPRYAAFKPFTNIRHAGMVLANTLVLNGPVHADGDKPDDHNAIPRLSLVGEQAMVKTNAEIQAGMAAIRSIDSGTKNIDIVGNLMCTWMSYGTGFRGALEFDPAFIDPARGFLTDRLSLPHGGSSRTIQGCWVVSLSPVPVLWTDAANIER